MKNLFLTTCIAALFGIAGNAFSQRNLNQKMFKMQSSDSYRNSNSNLNANFMASQTADRTESFAPPVLNNNQVVLQVNALMNVKADKFLAVFNLTQIGETAAKTNDLMNSRIDSFTNAIKKYGVGSREIYIDMIYMVPTFEYEVQKKLFSKTYNEVPAGFEMQKNIHISFKDINAIDDLVALAAKYEIYDLVKVDFFVENTEGVYDSLRNKSLSCINKKAVSLKKVNLVLSDKFEIIRESSRAVYPESQYPDYDAFVSQSIEAVTKKSGVTTVRKPKTVAYDQIPYSNYDIVINPFILEPVVQFIYTLQVVYTFERPEPKSKNYMLITPAGELKKLDIQ